MKKIKNYIWYEKHRPQKISQLSLSPAVKKGITKYIKDKDIPHLLFHGPFGSGKTTTAHILINTIPCQALMLNASSADRGVAVVKGKVKDFAGSQPLPGKIKIVFFDEADGLTPDAQMALKNTIETYSSKCRFIFTANNINKVVGAIRSRPIIYEFSRVDKEDVVEQMIEILDAEDVEYETEDVEEIVDRFYPDVRTIVNNLQAASISGELDPEDVSLFGIRPEDIIEHLKKGDLRSIRAALSNANDFSFIYRYVFDEYLPTCETEDGIDIAGTTVKHMFQESVVADKQINFLGYCIDVMDILKIDEIKF